MLILRVLDQQADRHVTDPHLTPSRNLPPTQKLAAQVLAMHEREHPGAARFCDIECCREASRIAGRG